MLFTLLFFNTVYFALKVFSAFVFFAAGLLYYDSWKVDRAIKTPLIRSFGFFFLAVAATFHATSVQIPFLLVAFQLIKLVGGGAIFVSLLAEPMLHAPKGRKK